MTTPTPTPELSPFDDDELERLFERLVGPDDDEPMPAAPVSPPADLPAEPPNEAV